MICVVRCGVSEIVGRDDQGLCLPVEPRSDVPNSIRQILSGWVEAGAGGCLLRVA